MRSPIVDKLKKWNLKKQNIQHDDNFIKLLLVDVYTSNVLAKSSVGSLNPDKLCFIRGLYTDTTDTGVILLLFSTQ